MEVSGTVLRKPVAKGSKSERSAIVLATASCEYVLRIMGGHPFSDPRLADLVGKRIRAEGEVTGNTFLLRTWSAE